MMREDEGHFMTLPGVVRLTHAMSRLSGDRRVPEPARGYYGRRLGWFVDTFALAGIDLRSHIERYTPPREYFRVHSEDEAVAHAASVRARGLEDGLVLGHYRGFSEGNLSLISIASLFCRDVHVGIEPGVRSEAYKHVQRLMSDARRGRVFVHAMPNIYWFWVNRDREYSNRGYGDLVGRIAPRLYFADASLPEEIHEEMRRRVEPGGGRLVRILSDRNMTTSRMEALGYW